MDPDLVAPIPLTPLKTILVRHGATAWSRSGRHTGRTDLPLLPEGETDAVHLRSKLSDALGGDAPGAVLSSPLERARETCRLSGFDAEACYDEDLLEWDYGAYEGLTTDQIRAERPGWELFRDGCPGGESLEDVARRAARVIDRLRSTAPLSERAVLVFAHGHLLRVFAALWAGFGPDKGRALPFATGSIGQLGWVREDPALERWNL